KASIALALDLLLPPLRQCVRALYRPDGESRHIDTSRKKKISSSGGAAKKLVITQLTEFSGTTLCAMNGLMLLGSANHSEWMAESSVLARRHCSITTALKIVPVSRLRAPTRTCAVATSAALLLQIVVPPRLA